LTRETGKYLQKCLFHCRFGYLKFNIKILAAGSRAVTWNRGREFKNTFINHLRDLERHNTGFFFVLFCFVITLALYKEVTFSFISTDGWLP
jgi:hypothetical protein